MNDVAQYWIDKLQLEAHPEGGYYKELYRSAQVIEIGQVQRSLYTSILFLLPGHQFSAFHRLSSDELWYFHTGYPVQIHLILQGQLHSVTLGHDPSRSEYLQYTIPQNTWFAATCTHPQGFSLVSCSVSPGFEFDDFELATQSHLTSLYPDLADTIRAYTRE